VSSVENKSDGFTGVTGVPRARATIELSRLSFGHMEENSLLDGSAVTSGMKHVPAAVTAKLTADMIEFSAVNLVLDLMVACVVHLEFSQEAARVQ
jgi:hypothetical protein